MASNFSGSYAAADVTFLLRRIEMASVHLEERERRIQSGSSHYSEMIGPEDAPTRERMRLFRECLQTNGRRFARDLATLAEALRQSGPDLTLVSIARAGTPIGVVLQRLLRGKMGEGNVRHYSISVIRDRGIDLQALRWIAERHDLESIRFLDGWTGKGTIAREIAGSLAAEATFRVVNPGLWVPLDISGSSFYAASEEDYLMPSSLLGGTISGLVSRSVLQKSDIGRPQFHACIELAHLRRYDLSRWFVDRMVDLSQGENFSLKRAEPEQSATQHELSQRFIDQLMTEFGIADRNRVKIGIGETVRVALRRQPERILLRDASTSDARMISRLAQLRGVPVEYRPAMLQAAVGLIADVLAP